MRITGVHCPKFYILGEICQLQADFNIIDYLKHFHENDHYRHTFGLFVEIAKD